MIVAVETQWYALISLFSNYHQVLIKGEDLAIPSMAIQYSEHPPVSWKRTTDVASFAPKRLKESDDTKDYSLTSLPVTKKMDRAEKERKRPARIEIPKASVSLGLFGEVGKKEGLVEEGFEVEGNEYWLASRKGTRHAMEDGYGVMTSINGDSKLAFFGVFDGHGGRAAVDFVSENLGQNVMSALADYDQNIVDGSLELAVKAGYLTTDREFLNKGIYSSLVNYPHSNVDSNTKVRSGACTATVVLRNGELIAANVGDCRIVLCKEGTAHALTSDHKVAREDERIRIENSGGYVSSHNGVCRVQGALVVSRAIGDESMKKWVISEPETTTLRLTPEHQFLIMASDGLWDQVSNQEAVDLVLKHKKSIECCKALVDLSSSRGSRDDITVMLVDLQKFL